MEDVEKTEDSKFTVPSACGGVSVTEFDFLAIHSFPSDSVLFSGDRGAIFHHLQRFN